MLPIIPGWVLIFFGLALISPKLATRARRLLLWWFFKNDIVCLKDWKKNQISLGFTTKRFPLILRKTDDLLDAGNQKKLTNLFSADKTIRALFPGSLKKFVVLNQVHGDGVEVLSDAALHEKEGFYPLLSCDAAMTNIQGLTLLVLSADCLPIFFNAGDWIASAHAGWKGSEKKIAQKTLKLLLEKSGTEAKNAKIIFGPSIRLRHYEVGPEFKKYFPESSFRRKKNKLYFDLAQENSRQLLQAGVLEKNLFDCGICTFDRNNHFHSYRKEKETAGRIISFIVKN